MSKTIRSSLLLLGVGLLCSLIILSDAPQNAYAQDENEEEEEFIPNGIPPLSKRVSVLDIPLSVFPFNERGSVPVFRDQFLEQITIQIEDVSVGQNNSIDITEDFLPLTASAVNSGIALYHESGAAVEGFSYSIGDYNSDNPIDLREPPTVEADPVIPGKFQITFKPTRGNPNTQLNLFNDQSPDFYIVVQTSINLLQGDRFEVSIPPDGIVIRDRNQNLPDNTLYDTRFPGDEFSDLNPRFAVPAIFEGDIVQFINVVDEKDNSNRVDVNSEPTSLLGLDFVGKPEKEYFLEEIRVNFVGLNIATVGKLITLLSHEGYMGASSAGLLAANPPGIVEQSVSYAPSFFYSPWFYNTPTDPETGEVIMETRTIDDEEIEYPITMPLDLEGKPLIPFFMGSDDPGNYVIGYNAYGPREIFAMANFPDVVSQNVLAAFQSDQPGGIFLFRERGGTRGKYDSGVDNLIKLDSSKFRIETFDIDPEEASNPESPIYNVLRRFLPGQIGGDDAKDIGPFLFGDDNLAAVLMGATEIPEPAEEPRPPFGSLECYMDPDCLYFDFMINVLRPFLGLTEGQIRYLAEYTEENGRTNAEELFTFPMVQGFSFVMPVAKNNAMSDLRAPAQRSGEFSGAEIYIGIRTSDKLRSLDSFVPFIRPGDVKIGTGVSNFLKGATEGVERLHSVSSAGFSRRNAPTTFPAIGRPRPRFQFEDLTQPGEGAKASNDNILYDSSLGSPPKPVIGIDAVDYGQNPMLMDNHESIELDLLDNFMTQNTVFQNIQIEFLPGPSNLVFNPAILGNIPFQFGVDVKFDRLVSSHDIALYIDDDTPRGNGVDDDGDGLIDEEYFNLQDDDGDGLIDEDLGDGTPKGTNGIFDSIDRPLPFYYDSFGTTQGFEQGIYVFNPNSVEKYQEYIEAIQSDDQDPVTTNTGDLLPLSLNEGSWFADLDLRALGYQTYEFPRTNLYPPSFNRPFGTAAGPPFDPPAYNQGTLIQPGSGGFAGGGGILGGVTLEPHTGLMDILYSIPGGPEFPYYPEDMYIEDPVSGDQFWMLALVSEDESNVSVVPDPDGDLRRTFALSMANAFRLVNPGQGFVRVGRTPLVVGVPGDNPQDPTGDAFTNAPFYQTGMTLSLLDGNELSDYLSSVGDTMSNAFEEVYTQIEDFNQEVEDAEADLEEGEEPEYPEIPDPVEVSIDDPYYGLGVNDFVDQNGGIYATNYMYQLQIPDENSGPLLGSDFYVVIRAGDEARIGDSFRVKISSGVRNRQYETLDPDDGTTTTVPAPDGGIGYHTFVETDYSAGNEAFYDVSKNQLTTTELVVRSENVQPQISFISPGSGLNVASDDFLFDITFDAEDPDDVATIQLFVDTDNQDFDGDFIPGSTLREGFDDSFTLNLQEDIPDFDPTQRYYIYARISDTVNPPIYTYADGYIVASDVEDGDGDGGGGNIVVRGDLQDTIDYVKVTRDGRFFSRGQAPAFQEIPSSTDVIDIETNDTFSGYVMVLVDGEVLGMGDLKTFRTQLQSNGELIFDSEDIAFYDNSLEGGELIESPTASQITIENARDVEVNFQDGSIYVLDGDGDMLFLGSEADRSFVPEPMGMDLYRDMELAPDGSHMYFLTGNGLMVTAGNASIPEWNNLVEEDIYRDMELVTQGVQVISMIITDENGNLTVLGGGEAESVTTLEPEEEIPPRSIRQVKLLPGGSVEPVLLVEGSGKVHALSSEPVVLPTDPFEFADVPGMMDDRVVDLETAYINLQNVVEGVRTILSSIEDEDLETIMSYVSPEYKDRSGADENGIRQALSSLFTFYEVNTYTESLAADESFTINNRGKYVNANVIVDFDGYFPVLEYRQPDVDTGATATEYQGYRIARAFFDQTIRFREVADGRFWQLAFFTVTNYGRRESELRDQEDFEFEDMSLIKTLPGNNKAGFYSPTSKQEDKVKFIHLDVDEDATFETVDLLVELQELTLNLLYGPPAIETAYYAGESVAQSPLTTINFRFQALGENEYKLVSMNMRQILQENPDVTIEFGADQDSPLSSLDGLELESPFGFGFKERGPVIAAFPKDADVIISGENFMAPNFISGIMMLPENTDIFTLNPRNTIQQYNRSVIKQNPYDPAFVDTGAQDEQAGYVSSIVPGRAYLVITRDGRHYGFIQVPEEDDVEDGIISFDYRYDESFELPDGF